MMNVGLKPQDTNSIENVLTVLSRRWTAAILIQLASGKKRHTELKRALAPISAKAMTERLNQLQRCGLVTRKSFREVPPRVEYELTQEGAKLFDLLKRIKVVSEKMPEEVLHAWGNPLLR